MTFNKINQTCDYNFVVNTFVFYRGFHKDKNDEKQALTKIYYFNAVKKNNTTLQPKGGHAMPWYGKLWDQFFLF